MWDKSKPNLSEKYLVHDGVNYYFNQSAIEWFSGRTVSYEELAETIAELLFFANGSNVFSYITGLDEETCNHLCNFTMRDDGLYFNNQKITSNCGEFYSDEVKDLFVPYILCLHAALSELYKNEKRKRERKAEYERNPVLLDLQKGLKDITIKVGRVYANVKET